jgi:hypothetical protein
LEGSDYNGAHGTDVSGDLGFIACFDTLWGKIEAGFAWHDEASVVCVRLHPGAVPLIMNS